MTPPPPIACEVPGCTFSTEDGIPSHELRIRRLEAHIEMVHKLGKQRPKPSQIPRPELEEDASEEEWGHFLVKWKRYKRSCLQGMTKTDMVDHLWACCPKELESAMKQVGTSLDSEEELLTYMEKLGVRKRNVLLNKVAFLDLHQNQGEPVKLFVTRLQGKAAVCDFTLPEGESDYTQHMVQHQLIKGLCDPRIQEDVLAHAATTEGAKMGLAEVINMVEAKESGRLDCESLQKSGGVRKVTEYRKVKAGAACRYCGGTGHDKYPERKVREKSCPAFDKVCDRCKHKGHFKRMCERPSVKGVEGKKASDSSSGESSDEGKRGSVATIYGAAQFCSATAATPDDEGTWFM